MLFFIFVCFILIVKVVIRIIQTKLQISKMVVGKKREFKHTKLYEQRAIAQCKKWIMHGRRGCLVIFHDKSGVHAYGSKKMKAVYERHYGQFATAASEDTKNLADIDSEVIEESVPPENDNENVVASMYNNTYLKELKCHLPLMSEDEVVNETRPLLRMEICKKLGEAIGNIKWSKPCHEVDLFPQNKWSTFCNPSQKQTKEFKNENVAKKKCSILKEFIMLFYLSRGINVRSHVVQDDKDILSKLRARSLKSLDEAYEEMYSEFCDPRLLGLSLQNPVPVSQTLGSRAGSSPSPASTETGPSSSASIRSSPASTEMASSSLTQPASLETQSRPSSPETLPRPSSPEYMPRLSSPETEELTSQASHETEDLTSQDSHETGSLANLAATGSLTRAASPGTLAGPASIESLSLASPPASPLDPLDIQVEMDIDDFLIEEPNTALDSELFDPVPEKDCRGRLIKPSRQARELETNTNEQTASPRPPTPPSSSPTRASPSPSYPSSPAPSALIRPSNSRQVFATTPSRVGRGKGNRFNAVNNRLVPTQNPHIDGAPNMKQQWKKWKSDYETEVKRELIKSRPSKEVLCNRCERFIPSSKFENHKMKYDYCQSSHSFIKYKNFEAANGVTSDNVI